MINIMKKNHGIEIMIRKIIGFKISEKITSIDKEAFMDNRGQINYIKLITEIDNHGQRLYEVSKLFGR